MTDLTTFSAVEAALGRRLVWWIISEDSFAEFGWVGPGKLDYGAGPAMFQPEWVGRLREESRYQATGGVS
jgi:hypothetical protein